MKKRSVNKLWVFRPGVLIFHEKHGERYFHVPTENHLHAACLLVLTERFNVGGWYHDPCTEKKHSWDPDPPQMSLEEIEKLPEGTIRGAAKKQHDKYSKWVQEREEGHREYLRIQEAIEEEDGAKAYYLLRSRSDYEYEGFTIMQFEAIEPLPRPMYPKHGNRWIDPVTGERFLFEDEEGLGWIRADYARIEHCVMAHKGEEVVRTGPPACEREVEA